MFHAAEENPKHLGLLEKLMGAVRPMFRAEVLAFGPDDPVLGGLRCRVAECGRTGRIRGLCYGHDSRWRREGKPDLDQFVETTNPRMKGHQPLASCRVDGCRRGRKERGLCARHHYAWQRSAHPDATRWAAEQPIVVEPDPSVICPISYCDLWIHHNLPFCLGHGSRWKEQGRPDIDEYARSYEDDSTPRHECVDLRAMPAYLRLETQYALQCRHDDAAVRIAPGTVQVVVNFLIGRGRPRCSIVTRTPGCRHGGSDSGHERNGPTGTPAGHC